MGEEIGPLYGLPSELRSPVKRKEKKTHIDDQGLWCNAMDSLLSRERVHRAVFAFAQPGAGDLRRLAIVSMRLNEKGNSRKIWKSTV